MVEEGLAAGPLPLPLRQDCRLPGSDRREGVGHTAPSTILAMDRVLLIAGPFASRVDGRTTAGGGDGPARAGRVERQLTEARGHANGARGGGLGGRRGGRVRWRRRRQRGAERPRAGRACGAIPGGGTSVFARALGLPRKPVAAAERVADAIVAGRTRRIALGRSKAAASASRAGLGFDAATVRRVEARGRAQDGRRPGDLAFAYELVRELGAGRFKIEPVLEVQGHGRAAAVLRRELRSVHVRRCDSVARRARSALRARPRSRGSRSGSLHARCRA